MEPSWIPPIILSVMRGTPGHSEPQMVREHWGKNTNGAAAESLQDVLLVFSLFPDGMKVFALCHFPKHNLRTTKSSIFLVLVYSAILISLRHLSCSMGQGSPHWISGWEAVLPQFHSSQLQYPLVTFPIL